MLFDVKAMGPSHEVLTYVLEAGDEADARRLILEQGRRVISLQGRQAMLRLARRRRLPLVQFSEELVALLDAGLTLVEGIEALTEKEALPSARRTLTQLRERLYQGATLSAALAELPDQFPPLYVATVRASERSGALRDALLRYVAYQRQIDVLRKKVVSASIYPMVLMGAGTLVSLFLLGYVVPRFSSIYEDMGGDLPLASRLLMRWGQLISGHGLTLGVLALAGLAAALYGLSRPATRAWIGRRLASIPSVGVQLHTYQLARLYRTVGMLLRGGVPAVTALQMSEGVLGERLREPFRQAVEAIRSGKSVTHAMERHGLTTPVAVRMLRVGERSGSMGEMMERIAAFYDEELARAVDILTRLIEPLLMSVIGIIIGLIVVLMYFPIFELAGSLQ
ncbi:MAG: type II secretion system F family protein [Gammaproteobacteria bacterium]|nr:type II secretion system F family protein [Gammaproteobacteria bacterium]